VPKTLVSVTTARRVSGEHEMMPGARLAWTLKLV